MIEKQIVLNKLLINYYSLGHEDQTAKPVIFLHGWRSNGLIWLSVVKNLLDSSAAADGNDSKLKIYCLDLPGFGKSELPSKGYMLSDYAEIVRSFLKRMNLEKVYLIGYSFGGRVAVKYAAKYPETLNKLMLISCGGFRKSEWKRGFVTFLAKIMKPAFALPLLKTFRPRIYNILGADDYLAVPELKSTFLNIINEDILQIASSVTSETSVVWGEKDLEVPLEFGRKIHSTIRDSKLVILPEAGHFSFLDQPDEFIRELNSFLNEPR